MLEDMQLRNLSAGTQRSYIHYVTDYAYYYNLSPAKLGLDDIRNYQLYLIEKRQLSPIPSTASSPPSSFSTPSPWKCPGPRPSSAA